MREGRLEWQNVARLPQFNICLLSSQPALKLVYTATKITIILITTFSGTKMHFPKSSQFERGGVQGSNLQERSHLQSPRSNAARCLHRLKVRSEGTRRVASPISFSQPHEQSPRSVSSCASTRVRARAKRCSHSRLGRPEHGGASGQTISHELKGTLGVASLNFGIGTFQGGRGGKT